MTLGQLAGVALVLSIIVYLALVAELFLYLEFRHRETWRELGEPWPWKATPSNIWRSTKFVFFGGVFKLWSDKGLRLRAISVWISFTLAMTALIIAKTIEGG
jgi:hypothetical protein